MKKYRVVCEFLQFDGYFDDIRAAEIYALAISRDVCKFVDIIRCDTGTMLRGYCNGQMVHLSGMGV